MEEEEEKKKRNLVQFCLVSLAVTFTSTWLDRFLLRAQSRVQYLTLSSCQASYFVGIAG